MKYFNSVDMDERGEFRASVRDGDTGRDSVVFEYDHEIFEDGFMRHKEDLAGLRDYLVSMSVINPGDTIATY